MEDTRFAKYEFLPTARVLFFINGAIWLSFGVISLLRLQTNNTVPFITLVVVAGLMFGNVGAMLLAGWSLGKRYRWAFGFSLAVLIANIFLTFTDQTGLFDLVTLLFDCVILVFVICARRELRNAAYN